MLFSSMVFLWVFLPIVIIVNFLLNLIGDKKKRIGIKNVFLLIVSLFFYAWGGIYFLTIMLFSIVVTFKLSLFRHIIIEEYPIALPISSTFLILFSLI